MHPWQPEYFNLHFRMYPQRSYIASQTLFIEAKALNLGFHHPITLFETVRFELGYCSLRLAKSCLPIIQALHINARCGSSDSDFTDIDPLPLKFLYLMKFIAHL